MNCHSIGRFANERADVLGMYEVDAIFFAKAGQLHSEPHNGIRVGHVNNICIRRGKYLRQGSIPSSGIDKKTEVNLRKQPDDS